MTSAPSTMAPAADAGLDLRQVGRVLARRRGLLVLPWAVALLVGVLLAFLLPPVYESTVTMYIQQPAALTQQVGDMVKSTMTPDQEADLMRQQAQSTAFLTSVIAATGLAHDPEVRGPILAHAPVHTPGFDPERYVVEQLVDRLRTKITVRRDKSDVIQIAADDGSRRRAQAIAAAVANQFVQGSRSNQVEMARSTQQFSMQQEDIYRRQLLAAEDRLRRAQLAAGAAAGPADDPTQQATASKARGYVQEAAAEVEDARDKVATLRRQLGAQAGLAARLSSPRVSELASQIIGLERQLSGAMLSDAGDNGSSARILISRKFGELESELSQNAARLSVSDDTRDLLVRLKLAEADLAARQAGQGYFAGQSAVARHRAVQAVGESPEITRLQQEVQNAQQLYNNFVQQSAAAQASQAYTNTPAGTEFQILEPATRPFNPSKPNRPVLILLAFVLGGILGVGTVLVVEQHDESVKDAEEIESLLGLPVMGAVPRVPELQRRRRRGVPDDPARRQQLLHRLQVESALGLEFRRIYLKLARTRDRALPRTLLVSSATRGEGKSTSAAALAITLARELREPVLLVDMDLRAPSLHRALGQPLASWGVAQMLQSRSFDPRFVRKTTVQGLDFLPAGRSERPAGELVDLASVEWLVKEAAARYAVVIIDAAPNLAVPDPLIIGRAVEGVLYVIKAGSTVRKAAEYGVKVQRDACDNVVGVLLNDVGEVLPAYYGYRSDTYGYASEAATGNG